MNGLITKCLATNDVSPLTNFPLVLMQPHEIAYVDWIKRFRVRFKMNPTMDRFEEEFPDFVPLVATKAAISEILEEVINRKRQLAIHNAAAWLSEGILEPQKVAQDLLSMLRADPSDTIAFSAFDRGEYFVERNRFWLMSDRINTMTGGVMDGELCYIVGRLGIGKTMIATWNIYNWWLQGKRVLITSNEMTYIELMTRLDGFGTGINPLDIRLGRISHSDPRLEVWQHIVSEVAGEIIVAKSRPRTPNEIQAMIEAYKPDALVVDGVYLLKPDDAKRNSQLWESVGSVSRALKQIALDHQIPIIGTHQASRSGKDHVTTEDIAYSDALGQDADIVVAIQPLDSKTRVMLELIKNRGGPGVGAAVRINFKTMTIEEAVEEYELDDL